MNNDSNQNLTENNMRAMEETQIEQNANELMYSTYDQLHQKYDNRILTEKFLTKLPVTNSDVPGYISMLKHLFILSFVPGENIFQVTVAKKNSIIELIAQAEPITTKEQIDQQLKTIDPTFSTPDNFQLVNYQIRAQELFNANYNVKNIIADNLVPEYLSDTMRFVALTDEKLKQYSNELTILSGKMELEYSKLLKNQTIGNEVIDEAINFLANTGRTPLFTQELKENKNLGDLTDLILKINTSLQVANVLKSKYSTVTPTTEQVNQEIKNYLMTDIQF